MGKRSSRWARSFSRLTRRGLRMPLHGSRRHVHCDHASALVATCRFLTRPIVLLQLLEDEFYDNTRFYEVIDGTETRGMKVVQGGIGVTAEANQKWTQIEDDPARVTNGKGMVCLAQTDANQRSTKFLIHLSDNSRMFDRRGSQQLRPFAQVIDGLDVLESLESTGAIGDRDADAMSTVLTGGNAYLDEIAPDLAYIKTARYSK